MANVQLNYIFYFCQFRPSQLSPTLPCTQSTYSLHIPWAKKEKFHPDSFSPKTVTLWNRLLIECFPNHYNHLKSRVSHYPSYIIYTFYSPTFACPYNNLIQLCSTLSGSCIGLTVVYKKNNDRILLCMLSASYINC